MFSYYGFLLVLLVLNLGFSIRANAKDSQKRTKETLAARNDRIRKDTISDFEILDAKVFKNLDAKRKIQYLNKVRDIYHIYNVNAEAASEEPRENAQNRMHKFQELMSSISAFLPIHEARAFYTAPQDNSHQQAEEGCMTTREYDFDRMQAMGQWRSQPRDRFFDNLPPERERRSGRLPDQDPQDLAKTKKYMQICQWVRGGDSENGARVRQQAMGTRRPSSRGNRQPAAYSAPSQNDSMCFKAGWASCQIPTEVEFEGVKLKCPSGQYACEPYTYPPKIGAGGLEPTCTSREQRGGIQMSVKCNKNKGDIRELINQNYIKEEDYRKELAYLAKDHADRCGKPSQMTDGNCVACLAAEEALGTATRKSMGIKRRLDGTCFRPNMDMVTDYANLKLKESMCREAGMRLQHQQAGQGATLRLTQSMPSQGTQTSGNFVEDCVNHVRKEFKQRNDPKGNWWDGGEGIQFEEEDQRRRQSDPPALLIPAKSEA